MSDEEDCCIECGKPVKPGTGGQAMGMFPALHSACARLAAGREPAYLYVLDANGEPRKAKSLLEWAEFFEDLPRREVARTKLSDGAQISTQFFGTAPMCMFETALIPAEGDVRPLTRTDTRADALEAHRGAVDGYLDALNRRRPS